MLKRLTSIFSDSLKKTAQSKLLKINFKNNSTKIEECLISM